MHFSSHVRRIGALIFLVLTQTTLGADLELGKATFGRLAQLPPGTKLSIDGFPVGAGGNATIRLQREEIYAADARIYVITAKGKQEVPRSDRIFLRGYSDDGKSRVALSLNPDGSFADGNGTGPDGSFVLHDRSDSAGKHWLYAQALEDSLPAGYKYDFHCGDESASMLVHNPDELLRKNVVNPPVPAAMTATIMRYAVVAVDTDSLFMSALFSNNTTTATNWIGKMFNTMNTMYENDLSVQLVQGTTFLRVGTDPYGAASNVPADGTDLNVFGGYWKANYASVGRSFATLLSGRGPCNSCGTNCTSCSASGIAWLNQYCQKGFINGSNTVGSYSVVQVFSSLAIDPNGTIAARLTGHELGHNFGADHTHCTDKTTGAFPVATNTIDTCYNGEGAAFGGQCYNGTQSCPAGGAGTIMSYCNVGACGGTQNLLQFNSTQITKTLTPNINAAASSCFNDVIFRDGFEP
jgi:hypothetical protein